MKTFSMSLKSIFYRRKQYLSLILVCFFGVGISLFSLFLVDGMLASLHYKARIYYGGDLQFIGENGWLYLTQPEEIIESIKPVFPDDAVISKRFDLEANYAYFYFEGTGVRQRVLKGVDFNSERALFSTWKFVEGNADITEKDNSILISEPIAQMLQIHAGDSLTFLYQLSNGVINTHELVVKGIFRDTSLFGMYTSYMDIDLLESIVGFPVGWANRIVIFFKDGAPSNKEINIYQSKLEEIYRMFPLVEDKKEFYNQMWSIEMPTYALIKLSANLQDVQILIDAMKLIAAFIIIMLVVIIVAGVSSTFRVIVMKRINEIGIYKAIGMKRQKIAGIMLTETMLLVTIGCIAGFILSLILTFLCRFINLSFVPAFDIFLSNGVLKPQISFVYFIIVSVIVIVTTAVAVLFAIRKSVRVSPCEALAVTE